MADQFGSPFLPCLTQIKYCHPQKEIVYNAWDHNFYRLCHGLTDIVNSIVGREVG